MEKNIKVFDIYNENSKNTGWHKSNEINYKELEKIKTDLDDVPTSIPSPYAQIDLVKSAFEWVVNNNKLEGKKAYHRLVSYTLDIAQLFFSIDKFKDKIKIVAWEPPKRFKHLIENDRSDKHRRLAKTLKLYWEQDNNESSEDMLYNFKDVKRLYFLLSNTNEILGSTSPITLFMPAPDVVKNAANLNLQIGSHKFFTDKYASLNERDPNFIKYLYLFSQQENFSSDFPELFGYIEKSIDTLNQTRNEFVKEIKNPNNSKILTDDTRLTVLNSDNDFVEVIGYQLYKSQLLPDESISKTSDFVIKPDFEVNELLPLVLPDTKFTEKNWIYTTKGNFWMDDYVAPYKNKELPEKSRLPILLDIYPWLSIGNFLEDKIVKLPYSVDSNSYFTGGVNDFKYLLPLSETFFKYFDVKNVAKYVKFEDIVGGVKVSLNIPLQKNKKITLSKTYAEKDIIEWDIHLAILPFVKRKELDKYKVAILDMRFDKDDEILIRHYKDGKLIKIDGRENFIEPVYRNLENSKGTTDLAYQLNNFDALQLQIGNHLASIVPLFPETEANNAIEYSVDFGTTNTHIEYKTGTGASRGFEHHLDIWRSLYNGIDEIEPIFRHAFLFFEKLLMPMKIGNNQEIKYPLRTALMWNKNINTENDIRIFMESNNYLLLGVKEEDKNFQYSTDIKWGGEQNQLKVESYIRFIIEVLYYKTLLLGGDLNEVKIIWFYPVSMGTSNINSLKNIWKTIFTEYFGKINNDKRLIAHPESIPPYFEYKTFITGLSLSVDIGGGSADIAVFDDLQKKPHLISSFRFAGNAMYGDGYANKDYIIDTHSNGMVKSFTEKARKAAEAAGEEKKKILDAILENGEPSREFINFLFQLENEKGINFSFTKLLINNDKFKINFLIYYASVIYYSAILMKKSGLGIPKNILLSGMASKSLHILDQSETKENFSNLVKFIFEKVFDQNVEYGIKIIISPNPKTITAKGGLKATSVETGEMPVKLWIGDDSEALDYNKDVSRIKKYKEFLNDEQSLESIKKSLDDFYQTLDEYVDSIRLSDIYNISGETYEIFKKLRKGKTLDNIKKGVEGFNHNEDNKIEETMFFYPLVDLLNMLTIELANS